jgi:hypothetical protein
MPAKLAKVPPNYKPSYYVEIHTTRDISKLEWYSDDSAIFNLKHHVLGWLWRNKKFKWWRMLSETKIVSISNTIILVRIYWEKGDYHFENRVKLFAAVKAIVNQTLT